MTSVPPLPHVPEVDLEELAQGLDRGVAVIDVRQREEYTAGHVPGARLIPLDEVIVRVGEVPTDEPVYVVCATGPRSERAVRFFRARGIDAYNVAGGTKGWAEAGQPLVFGPDPG